MNRPYTIIHIFSSLNGSITGPFMGMPSVGPLAREFGKIRDSYHADAWLYGTTTVKEFTRFEKPEILPEDHEEAQDHAVVHNESLCFVCVDPKGEIGWKDSVFKRAGRPDAHVIEILTEQAGDAYKGFLKRKGISWITAGKDELDMRLACEKLKELFGIERMLVAGGGVMDWTMLEQDLADELSIMIVPEADGDVPSARVFEDFSGKSDRAVSFRLESVNRAEPDGVHLVYKVRR